MVGGRRRGFMKISELGFERISLFEKYEKLTRERTRNNLEEVIEQIIKIKKLKRR